MTLNTLDSLNSPNGYSGARTGGQFKQRLQESRPAIWYRGHQVNDVTTHHAFKNVVDSLSGLYDLQHERKDQMLFRSKESGLNLNRSFMIAREKIDIVEIGTSLKLATAYSFGMMGRAPDYMNRCMASYAGASNYLSEINPQFGKNAKTYFEYISQNDLCLTHTLITPQANRAVNSARQTDPFLAARVKQETDSGIVIKGARMLATLPIADEIMVFPSTLLKNQEEDAPYAFGICIPTNSKGLTLLCRDGIDYGGSRYDHPLGSRFDEMDAVVMFDDVFVPWERVFLYRNVTLCNQAYLRTGAIVNMAHQAIAKAVSKTEFLLGLVALMTDTIGIEKYQHVQEKVAEIWVNLEIMKACLRAAEIDARLDEWGVMLPAWNPLDAARNLYPKLYPRMIEIVQLIGASGLIGMPTIYDLGGDLRENIEKYFQAARAEARDRIPIFKLAWDTAVSAFGSRQVLYERFFSGDPIRMAGALVTNHEREIVQYGELVREQLLYNLEHDV